MKSKRICLAIAPFFVYAAFAQEFWASLVARITDPSGAAVAGARINAVNEATNALASTVSNETGNYNSEEWLL